MPAFTHDSSASRELVSLVQRLSVCRDMESVMALVRRAARTLTGADGVTFVLREGETCFYADEDAISPLWKGQRFPLDTCISGWVMLHQQPAVIEDVFSDPRIPHAVYRRTFVQSLVMMPVRSEDPIAAIGAYWATRHRPTDAEVDLLHAVAQAAAVALINVTLYQSQRSALEQAERALAELRQAEQALKVAQAALERANHDLRTTNERLSLALRGAHAGTWDWDMKEDRVVWSDDCCELYGLEPAAMPASYHAWLGTVDPEDWPTVERTVQDRLTRTATDFAVEYRIRHPLTGVRWLAARGRILYDEQGCPTRILGLMLDLTERRQAESAARHAREEAERANVAKSRLQSDLERANHDLRTTNEWLSLALRGAHAGTWDWDMKEDRTVWSDTYYELHGFDRATTPASHQTWLSSLHPEDRSWVEWTSQNWLASHEGEFSLEYRICHPAKGVRWLADRGQILYDPQGRPLRATGLVLDITERRQAESEARQARDAAERANAAKSRFLAAASHDLRQPIQAAALFLGLLERRDLDPPTQTLVGQLATALSGVQGLLDGLLELARLESGMIVPEIGAVVLDELLVRLAQEFDGQAQAVGLWLRMPPTGRVVASDPLLLELILRNLLANALKYTTHGGVTVECRDDAGRVRLAVIDTGPGIPADQWDAIFEEFRQLDNPARDRARGVGLGLAMVDRAARLLGSRVIVHSELGTGSEFSLTLPRSDRPAAQAPAPAQTERGETGDDLAGRRIVVVEDDPGVRLALELLLQEWGLVVQTAASLEEVAVLVEGLAQPPNVVLADYRLAGGGCGTDAVALVQRRWPVPALLMTGDTAPERLAEAQRSGCRLLHKPVNPGALRQTLLECV
jgi:signal transduction histidine kinase